MNWPGAYLGSVVSTADPTGNGRVRLQVPQVSGTAVTGWAYPATSGGTNTPTVGQLVWVMYQGGDPSYPVYVPPIAQGLASGTETIPTHASFEKTPATITALTGGSGTAQFLELLLAGPVASGASDSLNVQLNSQNNDGSSNANLAVVDVASGNNLVAIDPTKVQLNTYMIKSGQTWQTPTLASGWALGPAGGSDQPLEFCVDGQDNLVMNGAIHCTVGSPTSIFCPALPSGFWPKITQRFVAVFNYNSNASICFVQINASNGNVTVFPTPANPSTDLYINVSVPLGNKK